MSGIPQKKKKEKEKNISFIQLSCGNSISYLKNKNESDINFLLVVLRVSPPFDLLRLLNL